MKKKLIWIFLMSFLVFPVLSIKAGNMDSYIDWNLDMGVFAHQYRNGSDHITNLAMITADGKVAYCIEPGVVADKGGMYNSTLNISDTNLNGVDVRRLSLIGYYGYGFDNHNVKEYYMAAQELVWRQMGVENVWWTDSKIGGNILNIDFYKNEILGLVNEYEKSPKFNFRDKYMVGDEFLLEDKNNVLSGYEVINNSNVSIEGNSIKIKVIEGDNSFVLRRKENGKSSKFYYKNGYQTIGSFEFPYNHESSYKINYTYGKITINKLDNDTKGKKTSSKYAQLDGAEYGLYDAKDNLIRKEKTNKEGYITFDKLPKGNYTIKELSPSLGYTLSKTVTRTFLGSGTLQVEIKSYEKIIRNKIVINKVLDDEENKTCTPEEGIKFELYDEEGNLVKEIITDENGNATFELLFGKYILKQVSSIDKVDMVKDKIIEVNKDIDTQNIVLVNHKIKEEPKIPEEPQKDPEIPQNSDILPKTGKSYSLIFLALVFQLYYLYEKKYS